MVPSIATSGVIHQTVPSGAKDGAFQKPINTVITVDKVSVLQFILITCSSSLSSRSSKFIEPFAHVSRWSIEGSEITTNGGPICTPTQAKFRLNTSEGYADRIWSNNRQDFLLLSQDTLLLMTSYKQFTGDFLQTNKQTHRSCNRHTSRHASQFASPLIVTGMSIADKLMVIERCSCD